MCCKEVFEEGGGAAGKSIGTQLFVQALCPGDPPFPSLHGMYLFAAGQRRLARPASQSGQRRPPAHCPCMVWWWEGGTCRCRREASRDGFDNMIVTLPNWEKLGVGAKACDSAQVCCLRVEPFQACQSKYIGKVASCRMELFSWKKYLISGLRYIVFRLQLVMKCSRSVLVY